MNIDQKTKRMVLLGITAVGGIAHIGPVASSLQPLLANAPIAGVTIQTIVGVVTVITVAMVWQKNL